VTFKVIVHRIGIHVRVMLFAGPAAGQLAQCGTLTMLPEEWTLVRQILESGATMAGDSLEFIVEEP
jgi:hypothetical protein